MRRCDLMEGNPLYSKRELVTVAGDLSSSSKDLNFSVVTYNILHDLPLHKLKDYNFCPREFISRDGGRECHRHRLLMEEVKWLDADILCLQEVDISYYNDILRPDLESLSYHGILAKEAMGLEEGTVLFFKGEIFCLVMEKQIVLNNMIQELCQKCCKDALLAHPTFPTVLLLVALKHRPSGNILAVGTTHIFWAYQKHTVTQALQLALSTKALHMFTKSLYSSQDSSHGLKVPYIFCGDFNIDPNFPAYELLSKGNLTDKDMEKLRKLDYVKWKKGAEPLEVPPDVELLMLDSLTSCFNSPLANLKSAYNVVLVKWLDADILCLQEVDISYYNDILRPDLESLSYHGILAKEAMGLEEGTVLFFKGEIFCLVMEKQIVLNNMIQELCQKCCKDALLAHPTFPTVLLLVALKHRPSGNILAVGTTHIFWAYQKHTVTQALQLALSTKALHMFTKSLYSSQDSSHGLKVPYIFCGDFNIDPNFPAYELLSKGNLTDKDMEKLRKLDYVKWKKGAEPLEVPPDVELLMLDSLTSCFNSPLANLKSAYNVVLGQEPEFTDHEGYYNVWTRDYIWFSADALRVTAALNTQPREMIDQLGGMPNEFLPSDHLSLKAHFEFNMKVKP